ncbi:MAG: hypothetical protein ACRDJ5_08260, partial [Actinomycetota bacterium]
LLVALNRPFYGLLLQRRGPLQATTGVALHALHHAVSAAAVPAGLLAEALSMVGTRPCRVMNESVCNGEEPASR